MKRQTALLLAGFLLVFSSPGCGKPLTEEDKAIEEIKKVGGNVTKGDDGKVIRASLHGRKIRDDHLKPLQVFPNLEDVTLYNSSISDDGLIHIAQLKSLKSLSLAFTKVSDAGLEHLKGMEKLEYIMLVETEVTKAGAEKFRKSFSRPIEVVGK